MTANNRILRALLDSADTPTVGMEQMLTLESLYSLSTARTQNHGYQRTASAGKGCREGHLKVVYFVLFSTFDYEKTVFLIETKIKHSQVTNYFNRRKLQSPLQALPNSETCYLQCRIRSLENIQTEQTTVFFANPT